MVGRSGHPIYLRLPNYLALVIPASALSAVLATFHEMVAAASSGKVTFGSIAAVWSAAAGISAIQDTLNVVHKVEGNRSYLAARVQAIGLTVLVVVIGMLALASMFAGDFLAEFAEQQIRDAALLWIAANAVRLTGWVVAMAFVALAFSVIYYWAPDWEHPQWHWLTPGASVGILGWLLASLGLRFYIHHFNSYTVTYGSLGAVIILMMWFYLAGLMILLGAEIDSTIKQAVAAIRPLAPDSLPPIPIERFRQG